MKRWTEEEDELLRHLTTAEVVARTGRTVRSVVQRRQRMGIRLSDEARAETRARTRDARAKALNERPWTVGEEALLGTVSDRAVARTIGRSAGAVTMHRIGLGIPRFRPTPARGPSARRESPDKPAPVPPAGSRLTGIGPDPARSENWLCRCSCGAEKSVRRRHVESGAIKSCGCLRAEAAGARAKGKRHSRRPANSPAPSRSR